MADPHWTSYVGMITGISGAIMGYISYRKSNNLKSLDLRLELRKAVNELYQTYKLAEDQINSASRSRRAVASATGNYNSGRHKVWEQSVENDTKIINEIKNTFPEKNDSFSILSTKDLESKLVDIHDKQCNLNSILVKYKDEITADNETRNHLRDTRDKL